MLVMETLTTTLPVAGGADQTDLCDASYLSRLCHIYSVLQYYRTQFYSKLDTAVNSTVIQQSIADQLSHHVTTGRQYLGSEWALTTLLVR